MPITLHIDGRMSVANLKDDFFEFTGCRLRVYRDRKGHLADDRMRLSDVRIYRGDAAGDLEFRPNLTVGQFCERMCDEFGIEVKVASPDDWVLADDRLTFSEVAHLRTQPTKGEMEEIIALKLAPKIEKDNLTRIADELAEKSRKVKDRELKKNIDTTVAFLDDLEESKKTRNYVRRVQQIIEHYGIKNLLLLIGSIISGNWIGVGVAAYTELETIHKIIEDAQNGKSNIY